MKKKPLPKLPNETAAQRKQRLAARKQLTLQAARIAYENSHKQK